MSSLTDVIPDDPGNPADDQPPRADDPDAAPADHQPASGPPASGPPSDNQGASDVPLEGDTVSARPMITVALLTAHHGNVRRDLDLSAEFVASIKANGVLVPLRITTGDDGSYLVIDGHRRLAAGSPGRHGPGTRRPGQGPGR